MTDTPKRILFVCLGNICRSPLAESVFKHLLAEVGATARYEVESAGTAGYHVGEAPDERSVAVARKFGVTCAGAGRQVCEEDFRRFDRILAMDQKNLRDLLARCPADLRGKVELMRSYDPQGGEDVPDPYYGGPGGFDDVYAMLERSCRRLLETLEDPAAQVARTPPTRSTRP